MMDINVLKSRLQGNVAVLFGGESSEREVSLKSGAAVIAAFEKLGINVVALDVKTRDLYQAIKQHDIKHAFIILHGGAGENGTVQTILKSAGVTYTGSGLLGCAIAMDKQRTKLLWQGAGIPTAAFLQVNENSQWSEVSALLGQKMMIKPSNEGSSIGMSLVNSEEEFKQALAIALQYDAEVIAEKWLSGDEYTVAILNGVALPMIRLKTTNVFYDYQAKYISNETQYICPCGLPEEKEAEIKQVVVKAFDLLSCSGWGRIDVMTDSDGYYYLLEANTVPGMTDHSLVPMAAAAAGKSFEMLVAEILEASL